MDERPGRAATGPAGERADVGFCGVGHGDGRNTVLERGRRIGARRLAQPVAKLEEEPRDRPARPPGHPTSWNLINAGTVLDGAPYPFPVFL